jgi:hypothetical protein
VAGYCEDGNETSDSRKGGECLDNFSDCQILKDSAPCSWLARDASTHLTKITKITRICLPLM